MIKPVTAAPSRVILEKKGDYQIIALVSIDDVNHEFDVTPMALITVAAVLEAGGGSAVVNVTKHSKGIPDRKVKFRLSSEIIPAPNSHE